MAYKRTYWENDVTLLNAQNMNNIEEGIVTLEESTWRYSTTEIQDCTDLEMLLIYSGGFDGLYHRTMITATIKEDSDISFTLKDSKYLIIIGKNLTLQLIGIDTGDRWTYTLGDEGLKPVASTGYVELGGLSRIADISEALAEHQYARDKFYRFKITNDFGESTVADGLYEGYIVDFEGGYGIEFRSYIPDGLVHFYDLGNNTYSSEANIPMIFDAGTLNTVEKLTSYEFIDGKTYIITLGESIGLEGRYIGTYRSYKGYYPDPEDNYEMTHGDIKYFTGISLSDGLPYKIDLTSALTVTPLSANHNLSFIDSGQFDSWGDLEEYAFEEDKIYYISLGGIFPAQLKLQGIFPLQDILMTGYFWAKYIVAGTKKYLHCYSVAGSGYRFTIDLTSSEVYKNPIDGVVNTFCLEVTNWDTDVDEVLKQYTDNYRGSVELMNGDSFIFESIKLCVGAGPQISSEVSADVIQYKEYVRGENAGKRYRRLYGSHELSKLWTEWEEIEQDSTTSSNNWVYSEERNIESAETLWKTLFPDRAHLDNIYFSDSTDLSDNIDDYLNYMYKLHFYSDDNNDWVTSVRDIVGSGMNIGWIRHMVSGGIYLYLLSLDGGTKAGTITKWQISYDGLHIDNLTVVNNSTTDSNLFQHVGGVTSLAGLDSIITEYSDRDKTYIFNFSNSGSNEHIVDDGLYIGRIVDTSGDVQLEFHSYVPDGVKYTYSQAYKTVESEVVIDTVIDAGNFYKTENILKYKFINGRHYIMKLGSEISIDGTFIATYTEQKGYYPDPDDPYEQIYGTIKYLEGVCINDGKIYKLDLTNDVTVTSLNKVVDDAALDSKLNTFNISNTLTNSEIDEMLEDYIDKNYISIISPINDNSFIFINIVRNYAVEQYKINSTQLLRRTYNIDNGFSNWSRVSQSIDDKGNYFELDSTVDSALQQLGEKYTDVDSRMTEVETTLTGLEKLLADI